VRVASAGISARHAARYGAPMTATVEVSRDISASPAAVFAAISDVTRMGEWSPECHTCEWNDEATGPAVGVSFTGHNRLDDNEWTTVGMITSCEPGERFHFDAMFGDFVFGHWGYDIEATEGGCRVTESWADLRPPKAVEAGAAISGVTDRASHNRAGMEATLAGLAAAVE
jgi:uncharacterized protein YndB with AHSA1/START domain